jgi:hypothetical protein
MRNYWTRSLMMVSLLLKRLSKCSTGAFILDFLRLVIIVAYLDEAIINEIEHVYPILMYSWWSNRGRYQLFPDAPSWSDCRGRLLSWVGSPMPASCQPPLFPSCACLSQLRLPFKLFIFPINLRIYENLFDPEEFLTEHINGVCYDLPLYGL